MAGQEDRASWRALVERGVRGRVGSVLYDGASSTLVDVFSGKALRLDWSRVSAAEERADARTGRPYVALRLESGLEVAVADPGIVFAPAPAPAVTLEGLPGAVCFRDLATAEGRLEHFLRHHPDEPPDRDHLSLFFLCLAIVDGARAVGFDVSPEERRLEGLLRDLEARRRG